jgi:hypothetical protein
MGSRNGSGNDGAARPDGDGFYGDGYDGEYAYGDNGYGDDYGSYGYGYGYGYGGYGDGGGVVLPDNDPNPTNDPFLPGGDSYYGG